MIVKRRITPACAGKIRLAVDTGSVRDHPRMYGEKQKDIAAKEAKGSPRVCGEKWKTSSQTASSMLGSPRVCGEKTKKIP